VYLAEEHGADAIDVRTMPGSREPMMSTAYGRAILSRFSDEDVRDPIVGIRSASDDPIQDTDAHYEQIREVRERGYAIDDGETREGVRTVAAPSVVGGRTVGAIGVSGPKSRFTDEAIAERLGPLVRTAAETIEIEGVVTR
jgi:DNA-binding IclR family transcriptional regulator